MKCKNCGNTIPEDALMCNCCRKATGGKISLSNIPTADMYGNSIIVFTPDEHKNCARENYLIRRHVLDDIVDDRVKKLHQRKMSYYTNKDVIGYSLLVKQKTDAWGDITQYYTFHEIDKRNIRYISYDSKYGEYVLHLYKPVYLDYTLGPICEFRIQDIFEDNKLSLVLKISLPPKNIMY